MQSKFVTINDARTNGSLDMPRDRLVHYVLAGGVVAFCVVALCWQF